MLATRSGGARGGGGGVGYDGGLRWRAEAERGWSREERAEREICEEARSYLQKK